MTSSLLSTPSLCHPTPLSSSSLGSNSPSHTSGMSFLGRFRSSKNKHDSGLSSNSSSGPSQLKRALSSLKSHNNTATATNNPFATPTYMNRSPPTRRPAATSTFSDPPPAYTPTSAYSPPVISTNDDQYAFLSSFDTVFVIDDSGSMAGRSWRETAAALSAIAPVCTAHDADGIDIYFLNAPDNSEYLNVKSATDVSRIFESVRPYGGTKTGEKLRTILQPYLRQIEQRGADNVKPLNIIVITDGVPSDDPESEIKMAMRKLEKADAPMWQLGIQFFQVGNEYGAAEALRYLDEEVKIAGCDRDIVDTTPWKADSGGLSGEGILKCVLGAVNKRLDRKRNSSEGLRPNRRE